MRLLRPGYRGHGRKLGRNKTSKMLRMDDVEGTAVKASFGCWPRGKPLDGDEWRESVGKRSGHGR